nr:ECF transporter S component [Bombiscardovia coagulans]
MKETSLSMSMPSSDENKELYSNNTASHQSNSHSTGASRTGRWSTQRIAIYAMFVALTILVSFFSFPIFQMAPFLTYDPSGIVVLVAGFAFGPAAAVIVSVLGFLPHIFSDPFGAMISIVVALALSVPSAYIYQKIRTRKGALLGISVGAVAALIVAIGCNIIITPFYAHLSMQAVLHMIVPILLPFNVIKFTIHGVVTFLIYKPVSNLVNRSH